jgi:fluoride ion exporter CrcB/FEX
MAEWPNAPFFFATGFLGSILGRRTTFSTLSGDVNSS